MRDFEGRVAVVTGAASGIGKALAMKFADKGSKVVLADIDDRALSVTAEEIRKSGVDVLAVRTDVSQGDEVEALAQQTLAEFGAVHLVCNNAGVGGDLAWSWEHTPEMWQWTMGVNLWGVIHGIRTFVPVMLEQNTEGHIVNTASMAGLTSMPLFSVYHATKQAVVTLSESLHFELAMQQAKVKVSVLCPGAVRTGVMDFKRHQPDRLRSSGLARTAMAQAWYETWCKLVDSGSSTAQVADQVLRSIQEEKFYIFTHPELLSLVSQRTKAILQQRNPESAIPPAIAAVLDGVMRNAPS